MRRITAPKSVRAVSGTRTPKLPAARTSDAARAERIRAFEGTQPTLRQSPPSRCRSSNATRAPAPAAKLAAINPAVPAPTTTRW